MKVNHPQKFALMTLLALGLAGVLLLQAMSGTLARRAPELAVTLMPGNGEAIDRLAFARFAEGASDPEDAAVIARAARSAAPGAREALAIEPLLSRSLTVIGLAETDIEEQARFLELADDINRRDVSLQGVRLGNQVALEDFDGVFETVDRIMRVGPEFSSQFFPILLAAFQEERGVARLLELSQAESPWLNKFLLYSVRQDEVLDELADFRLQTQVDDEFDRLLIANLIEQESYERAQELYRNFTAQGGESRQAATQRLAWEFDFPPFGWFLADRPGLRAQPSGNLDAIEISVGSGEDGVLAERVIPAPDGPFAIAITHDMTRTEQLKYFQLVLHCGDIARPFLAQALLSQSNRVSIEQVPAACDFIHVALYARVFSSQPRLRGIVSGVELIDG